MDTNLIQNQIDYIFKDSRLLKIALTHKSYLSFRGRDKTAKEHNERMEFLGDAVLELVVTSYLYNNYSKNEGYMTSLRSSLVNYKIMGEIGNSLGLDQQILLSAGEKAELGKARLTIVADCLEAIIGAIYIDGGYDCASEFIHKFIIIKAEDIIRSESFRDAKTELQEYTQKHLKLSPIYQVLSTEGKDHDKTFYIAVYLGEQMYGEGNGKSKQDAETICASKALARLKEEDKVVIRV
jgi:ribonuclease III